jgi:hypothetical protein
MKTKTLMACLITGVLTLSQSAWAAGNRNNSSFESRQRPRQAQRPATLSAPSVSGVVPRAIRGGNPLQMLNPFAPAKYGRAGDSVSLDPDVPGRVNGINFVSISF